MEGKQKHLSTKHLLPEIPSSPKYYTSKENSFLEIKTQNASLKYQGSNFKFKSLKGNNKTFNGNASSAKDKQQRIHPDIKSFSFKFPKLQGQKDKLMSLSSNNSTIEHREFSHQPDGKKRNLFVNNLQDLQKIYEQNQLNNFYSSHKILGSKDKKKKINTQNNSIEKINSVSNSPKQG